MQRTIAVLALAFAFAAAPLAAQEELPITRVAQPGHVHPRATIGEFAWIVGTWEGAGIDGHRVQESYAAPVGGMIAGTFVQLDSEGQVRFSEYIQIVEHEGSLIMRLKHFNPDFTAWEEKAEFASFPLIAREGDSWFFDGLTYRRESEHALTAAVRATREGGTVSELRFELDRISD